MTEEKLRLSTTTDGKPPREGFESAGAPTPIDPQTGQHEAYYVLSPEERAKGFVRPVRREYRHVGPPGPTGKLRDLTDEEKEKYSAFGYVVYEQYPESEAPKAGRFWTAEQLTRKGCGQVTSMGQAIAETYARDLSYYGSTFCARCRAHYPVGEYGEFEWLDGSKVGT